MEESTEMIVPVPGHATKLRRPTDSERRDRDQKKEKIFDFRLHPENIRVK